MSMLLRGAARQGDTERQAGFAALIELRAPWVERFMVRGKRTIPIVRTRLSARDRWGSLKARWDVGRMNYRVLPGLYAVGSPDEASDVFVTANYKMSFDALRSSLGGLDAWILVLDTKGINVWCAAGKGTFGTDELVSRIASVRLADLVSRRTLVLPQLGAPGVSAPEVARRSGFRVEWGPVRAADIAAWLAAGRAKDERMREVRFDLKDRLAVAPVELAHAGPVALGALVLAALYALPAGPLWAGRAARAAAVLLGTIPVGTLLFPALLPILPTRAFAVKGTALGLCWGLLASALLGLPPLATAGGTLVSGATVAFLAMNFTGSSTYTSQPGALLEVERGFWPMAASLVLGLAASAASRALGL